MVSEERGRGRARDTDTPQRQSNPQELPPGMSSYRGRVFRAYTAPSPGNLTSARMLSSQPRPRAAVDQWLNEVEDNTGNPTGLIVPQQTPGQGLTESPGARRSKRHPAEIRLEVMSILSGSTAAGDPFPPRRDEQGITVVSPNQFNLPPFPANVGDSSSQAFHPDGEFQHFRERRNGEPAQPVLRRSNAIRRNNTAPLIRPRESPEVQQSTYPSNPIQPSFPSLAAGDGSPRRLQRRQGSSSLRPEYRSERSYSSPRSPARVHANPPASSGPVPPHTPPQRIPGAISRAAQRSRTSHPSASTSAQGFALEGSAPQPRRTPRQTRHWPFTNVNGDFNFEADHDLSGPLDENGEPSWHREERWREE